MKIITRYLGTTIITYILLVILLLFGLQAFIEFIREFPNIGTGSYGLMLGTFENGIVKGILTDSCVSRGQDYAAPLRSQFVNNLAINESTSGYYGYYFGNNGTGYNQFIACNYYNCATGILKTGHARWDYWHYHAFD